MLGTSNWKLATFYPLFWRKVQSVFMPAIITLDPQAPKGQLMFVMTLNCVVVARCTHSNSNSNWRACNMQQHCGRLPAIRLGIFSIGEYPPFLLFYIFSPHSCCCCRKLQFLAGSDKASAAIFVLRPGQLIYH